jgi:hypothetical protein
LTAAAGWASKSRTPSATAAGWLRFVEGMCGASSCDASVSEQRAGPSYHAWRSFAPLAAPKNASLLFAASHLLVLFLVLYVLDRKRIFLKA